MSAAAKEKLVNDPAVAGVRERIGAEFFRIRKTKVPWVAIDRPTMDTGRQCQQNSNMSLTISVYCA